MKHINIDLSPVLKVLVFSYILDVALSFSNNIHLSHMIEIMFCFCVFLLHGETIKIYLMKLRRLTKRIQFKIFRKFDILNLWQFNIFKTTGLLK